MNLEFQSNVKLKAHLDKFHAPRIPKVKAKATQTTGKTLPTTPVEYDLKFIDQTFNKLVHGHDSITNKKFVKYNRIVKQDLNKLLFNGKSMKWGTIDLPEPEAREYTEADTKLLYSSANEFKKLTDSIRDNSRTDKNQFYVAEAGLGIAGALENQAGNRGMIVNLTEWASNKLVINGTEFKLIKYMTSKLSQVISDQNLINWYADKLSEYMQGVANKITYVWSTTPTHFIQESWGYAGWTSCHTIKLPDEGKANFLRTGYTWTPAVAQSFDKTTSIVLVNKKPNKYHRGQHNAWEARFKIYIDVENKKYFIGNTYPKKTHPSKTKGPVKIVYEQVLKHLKHKGLTEGSPEDFKTGGDWYLGHYNDYNMDRVRRDTKFSLNNLVGISEKDWKERIRYEIEAIKE